MKAQAYFDDIQGRILNELEKARHNIYVAVAWFTDKELFAVLCKKARNGPGVELLLTDDRINTQSGSAHEKINQLGGRVFLLADKNTKAETRPKKDFAENYSYRKASIGSSRDALYAG